MAKKRAKAKSSSKTRKKVSPKKAKPKTVKKKAAKTTRQNKNTNYVHIDVPDNKAFFVCDGSTLKNIRQLEECFERIPDDMYTHHCNDQKNDFARWIHDVMGETKLADKLVHKNKNEARLEIVKHIIKNI